MSTATNANTPTHPGTGTGRKIRGDSKLAQLSSEQQASVRHWLGEKNYTYAHVTELIQTNFNLCVGRSALSVYYQRYVLPERHDDDTESAAALAALPPAEFDAATVNHAKALAFNAIVRPDPQIDTAARLLALVHRVEKQEMSRERLALEKRRVALREAELAARPRRSSERPAPRPALGPRLATLSSQLLSATSVLDDVEARLSKPSAPPRPARPQPPSDLPPAPLRQTPPSAEPPPSSTPESFLPASVTSVPPSCPPCPNSDPIASLPLSPPPTPDSSFSSFPSVQTSPPSPPQKSPQNPPLLPTYSDLTQPPTPAQSTLLAFDAQPPPDSAAAA